MGVVGYTVAYNKALYDQELCIVLLSEDIAAIESYFILM